MERVKKGRVILFIIIAVVLLLDAATTTATSISYLISDMADVSRQTLIQGGIRLLLTGLLLYLLYKGNRFAKWLLVFLFILGGLMGVIAFLGTMNLMNLITGVIYEVFGILLIMSKNITTFILFQRNEYNPNATADIDVEATTTEDDNLLK